MTQYSFERHAERLYDMAGALDYASTQVGHIDTDLPDHVREILEHRVSGLLHTLASLSHLAAALGNNAEEWALVIGQHGAVPTAKRSA